MSQDLFSEEEVNAFLADVEDNAADDPDGCDTPVEFSGVSASGTSSSPGSQKVPPPPPPAHIRPVSGPSGSQIFPCPVCHKVLQTKRGFTGHMSRFHGASSPSAVPAIVLTFPTTPASSQVQSYKCPDCQSVLTTKSGFSRHQAAHKLKEISKKIPTVSQFQQDALESTMDEIIDELLTELFRGEEATNPKIKLLKEFSSLKGSMERSAFETTLVNKICSLVFVRQTKLLPNNQYEEAQKKLSVMLNEDDHLLKGTLHLVCNVPVEDALLGRLVFRIATKFLKKSAVLGVAKNEIS